MIASIPFTAKRFLPATAAALLAAVGGCTQPGTTATGPTAPAPTSRMVAGGTDKRFVMLDANGDGKATMAEFEAGFSKVLLAQYDTDHNGEITLLEWNAVERARGEKVEAQFRALDRNHDGKLSEAELSSGKGHDSVVRERFERLDLNKDGAITEPEARAYGIKRESDRDPANHP